MRSEFQFSCAALLVGLASLASPAAAQVPHASAGQVPDTATAPFVENGEAKVLQYDLSGPRLGASFLPDGTVRSQFGWHFEHQAAPRSRGPWLVVEQVVLVGGVEQREFVPSGSLIFGARTPGGYEFGLGPSVSLGGPFGANTAVVFAVGRTFRLEGIRIPVNLALATNRDGQRFSVVTGWAIRQ